MVGAKFVGSVERVLLSGEAWWGARVLEMRSVFDL